MLIDSSITTIYDQGKRSKQKEDNNILIKCIPIIPAACLKKLCSQKDLAKCESCENEGKKWEYMPHYTIDEDTGEIRMMPGLQDIE